MPERCPVTALAASTEVEESPLSSLVTGRKLARARMSPTSAQVQRGARERVIDLRELGGVGASQATDSI
jgi:hypothetical protein